MDFERIFTEISPEEIGDNVFKMVGRDFYVVTAGKAEHYNSMTASGGGWALMFRKPSTLCLMQRTRYTLELIERERTYTMCYFPDEYREQVLFLGSKSGRDSGKMREVELTAVQTPSGDVAFGEARLIFECRLTQLTTPTPEDFYAQEARDYIAETYKDPNEYRKYVFGEITHVWVKR